MKRVVAIVTMLVLFAGGAKGQESEAIATAHVSTEGGIERAARADYEFGRYLVGKGLLRDATTLVNNLLPDEYYPAESLDSLRYLKGVVNYHNRQFDKAALAFGTVSPNSPFYAGSSFYGSVCHLLEGDTAGARRQLDLFAQSPIAAHHDQLLALHRGGVAILEGDREEYVRQQSLFNYTHPIVANHQRELDRVASPPQRQPKAWVAGVASAIVPGLGQIYAGQVSEGVASFMAVGAFAALTATSWVKAESPANLRTITYGTIASLLYVSNIFGSVASVKVYYQNFEEINREAVMYSIHIPLRELFD